MNSKSIGADLAYAWPTAELAVMGSAGAVEIVHRRDLMNADDPATLRKQLIEEYEEQYASPYIAAERGFIDDVIDPAETRRILSALSSCCAASARTCRGASTGTSRCEPRPNPRPELPPDELAALLAAAKKYYALRKSLPSLIWCRIGDSRDVGSTPRRSLIVDPDWAKAIRRFPRGRP